MEVQQIDPKSILCPSQVRTAFKNISIEELIESIKAVGILQPVLLRRDGKLLVSLDGASRIKAAIDMGLPTVPALILEQGMDDAGIIQRQLIANCVREDLSPLDQANGIHNLMVASGCTAAEVASRIGKSAGTVSKLLSLLGASEEVRSKLASGEIGVKAAYDLIRSTPAAQPAPKPVRYSKLTAVLDAARSVTVQGVDSTIDAFLTVLDELLTRTKAAKKQGIELPTLLAMFKDQAKA